MHGKPENITGGLPFVSLNGGKVPPESNEEEGGCNGYIFGFNSDRNIRCSPDQSHT